MWLLVEHVGEADGDEAADDEELREPGEQGEARDAGEQEEACDPVPLS